MKMHTWCFALLMSIITTNGATMAEDKLWEALEGRLRPHAIPLRISPCTDTDISDFCRAAGILETSFPSQLRTYLTTFGQYMFNASHMKLDMMCFQLKDEDQGAVKIVGDAWNQGLDRNYLPFCVDNGDLYCINMQDGTVAYWSHVTRGLTDEQWPSLFDLIQENS